MLNGFRNSLNLQPGAYYANAAGRVFGPMEIASPGFTDQHGSRYHPSGQHFDRPFGHVENLSLELSNMEIALRAPSGIFCANHRGEVLGPMLEARPGVVADHAGKLYSLSGEVLGESLPLTDHIALRLNDDDLAALRRR